MTLEHTKIGHFPTNSYLQNKLIQNLSKKLKKKTYPNFFFNKNNDNRPKKKKKNASSHAHMMRLVWVYLYFHTINLLIVSFICRIL